MNSISGLVSVLALVCTTTFAQVPPAQVQSLYSCDVTKYNGIMYKKGSIQGENKWSEIETFEGCVGECLINNKCKAVNYLTDDMMCQILSEGVTSANTDKSLFDRYGPAAHAYINCPPPKPSGPVGCGKQAAAYNPKTTRIIGGKEAVAGSWPWLVSLIIDTRNGYTGAGCGASLVRVKDNVEKSDILITAAHCVTKEETMATKPVAYNPDQFFAIAGNHKKTQYDAGEAHRQISQVRFHPDFKFSPYGGAVNDMAILKLATPLDFTDTIRPICMPTTGEALPIGKTCIAAGWGRNNSRTASSPENLQQVVAPTQDPNTCKRAWGQTYNEQMMICAGSMNGDSGTCQGDSGGMFACQQQSGGGWTLYGVSSFAVAGSCVANGRPPVFARVSNYVDWVAKNVQEMTSL